MINNVAGQRSIRKNPLYFYALAMDNPKLKKTILFTIASKIMRNNLTEVEDFYTDNYKI